jgi:Rrf2 family protein
LPTARPIVTRPAKCARSATARYIRVNEAIRHEHHNDPILLPSFPINKKGYPTAGNRINAPYPLTPSTPNLYHSDGISLETTALRLSKRTEYGLRSVVQLARLWPTGFIQSRDLAQQEDLPNKFLEAILLALRRGGFLESKVGSGGGYRLARHPRDIAVGDLIRRLEGRLTIKEKEGVATADLSPGKAAVRLVNERLTQATDDVLDKMTLEQLMEQVNRFASVQQSMYYI